MTDYRNVMQRLLSMQENITNQIDAEIELSSLDRSEFEEVIRIKDYYFKKVASATGIYDGVDNPEKLIHFLRLKTFLDERGWDPMKFIDAQFESLAWCNGLPEPSQMYNDKAIERYNKYLYKNKNKQLLDNEPQVEGSLWDKIKD